MTRLQQLTEEQKVVLTVLLDRCKRAEGPAPVEMIARGTAWPGARTYGVARTRRILRELRAEWLARRLNFGPRPPRPGALTGVQWELDVEGYRAAGGRER